MVLLCTVKTATIARLMMMIKEATMARQGRRVFILPNL